MTAVTDKDLGYRDLMKRLGGMHSTQVLVGVRSTGHELAISDEGIVGESLDLAEIAAINEFGSSDGHVPERSFLRATIDQHRAEYARELEVAVERMIDGAPPALAYGRLGLRAVADVQARIRAHIPPPNAPSTIRRKGSSTPLIDTGRLIQSIDYTIEDWR